MNLIIPEDVKRYVRKHFAKCNKGVASDLSLFPAIHEESLDMNLIGYWGKNQQPVKLKSGWTVRVDAHFIGGGRHFGTWEVADIGLMIIFRRRGKVVRSKMAFLQSKKLYANSLVFNKDNPHIRRFGMGRLLVTEEEHTEIIKPRLLHFTEASKYNAFQKDNDQQQAMKSFQERFGMKMYYLLYNPLIIPYSIKMPVEVHPKFGKNKIGCRVIPKDFLDEALASYPAKHTPSFGDIKYMLSGEFLNKQHDAGWRLEYFIVDLMMACKEGIIDDSPNFETVLRFLNDKRSPMSSSLSVTIDSPE
jgi:hypothetical protein